MAYQLPQGIFLDRVTTERKEANPPIAMLLCIKRFPDENNQMKNEKCPMQVRAAARKCFPNEFGGEPAKPGVGRGSDPCLVCWTGPCCMLGSHRQTPHLANGPSKAECLTVCETADQVRAKGFSLRPLASSSNPRLKSF